jgi:hypothetical protein
VRRLGVLLLCALALPAGSARAWSWPVDGQVLRGFDFDRAHPYAGGQHRGVDISAALGAPILAPAEGVVSFAGTVPGGGKTISLQTPFGTTVTLLHLGSIRVKRGQTVDERSVVAAVGPSTDAALPDPHVYLGIRTTADPEGYLDPLTFLPPRAADPGPARKPAPAAVPAAEPAVDLSPGVEAVSAAEPAPVGEAASEAETPAAGDEPAETTGEPTASPIAAPQSRVRSRPGAVAGATETGPAPSAAVAPGVGDATPRRQRASTAAGSGRPVAPVASAPAVAPHEAEPHDPRWDVSETVRGVSRHHRATLPVTLGAAFGLIVLAALGAGVARRRAWPKAVRMMDGPEPESAVARDDAEERPRRAGLAVCVGPTPPRSRGGVRGARGHLRALPPLEGQPGADGERDGRARHAGDGHGGQGRRLAA